MGCARCDVHRFGGRPLACRLSLYHGTVVQCIEGRARP